MLILEEVAKFDDPRNGRREFGMSKLPLLLWRREATVAALGWELFSGPITVAELNGLLCFLLVGDSAAILARTVCDN